jgi:DNA-directed RNA polymerase subunit RPC12/RpoP
MQDERAPGSGQPTNYPADVSLGEVLAEFEADGFTDQFEIDDATGACTCGACGRATSPDSIDVVTGRRLEGASDPAEMSTVLGVRCPHCGRRGTAVCRYGPEASEGEAALLLAARGATGS